MLRPAGTQTYRPALLVFVVGFLTAILWTFILFPRTTPIQQVFDLNQFGVIGESVYRGDGFSMKGWQYASDDPTIRRAPLYPHLIAGVFTIFGFDQENRQASYAPLLVTQCLFAALACLATYAIANTLFGRPTALVAGLLCAVWPQALRYVGTIDVETTITLLITLMTLSAVRFYREPNVLNGALLGAAVGLATLTKPVALLFPLVIAAAIVVPKLRRRGPLPVAPFAACAAVLAVLVTPWVVRNHIVTDGRFHGISSNASGEFLRGYVTARPEFALLRTPFQGTWDWEANLFEDALFRQYGFEIVGEDNGRQVKTHTTLEDEVRKEELGNRIAVDLVLKNPLGFATKFATQLFTFWYLVETPGKSLLVGLFALLAFGLAAVGWRRSAAEGTDVAPIVATILYFWILYAALLGLARYSMPLFPSLLVLSGYGLVSIVPGLAKITLKPAAFRTRKPATA